MKTLLILRHGKASWDESGPDHDRVLRPRGRRAARTMGRFISRAGLEPAHAIVSSAVRTRTTFEEARDAGGWTCGAEILPSLYLGGCDQVFEALATVPDDIRRVIYVGHQPTCGELVGDLAGATGVQFPTAALARVDLAAPSWREVADAFGELIFLVPPRLFRPGHFDFVDDDLDSAREDGAAPER